MLIVFIITNAYAGTSYILQGIFTLKVQEKMIYIDKTFMVGM